MHGRGNDNSISSQLTHTPVENRAVDGRRKVGLQKVGCAPAEWQEDPGDWEQQVGDDAGVHEVVGVHMAGHCVTLALNWKEGACLVAHAVDARG